MSNCPEPPPAAQLRNLPAVSALLKTASGLALQERFGRRVATDGLRHEVGLTRQALRAGMDKVPAAADLVSRALARLERDGRSSLRPLFNLTGIVLHTNLGRAVLAETAIAAALAAMKDPVALEYDLVSGKRGERDDHIRALLCDLTGAEDATLVNNNAAAVLLALNSLAAGREVIVSRGELIEIGGAFRLPDIMQRAGVRLVEVGTTNRTHARDYRAAVTPNSGLILKVHTSNYVVKGFTAAVGAAELAVLAGAAGLPLMNDLGSGTLIDLSRHGLQREPTVREAVAQGAGIVTFSGDKLLGGPQAGFIVGKKALIAAINDNPLKRALRVDKIRLAAIAATLNIYRDPDRLKEHLPTLRLLVRPAADIAAQARRLLPRVADLIGPNYAVSVCACQSQIGSGALPLDSIDSAGVRIDAGGGALERLAAALRLLERPVLGRISEGSLTLDFRCLDDEKGFLRSLSGLARRQESDGLA